MDVDFATYQLVRSYPGGAAALATLLPMTQSSISHKANPRYPGAHFSPREFIDLMVCSGDKSPLRAMAAELGELCIPMPDAAVAGEEAGRQVARTVQEFSEMLTVSTDGLSGAKGITDNKMADIEREALEAIAAIHALVALARRVHQASKPAGPDVDSVCGIVGARS